METKKTTNQKGKASKQNSNSDDSSNNNRSDRYRTLLVTEGWVVRPILNPMQKTMGRILAEADLRPYLMREKTPAGTMFIN